MKYQDIFSLKGKTALVAGASRGIGLAIAEAVAEAGARTVLASRNMHALEENAMRLRGEGLLAEAHELDITDQASVRALADAYPEIDILYNVAGINQRKPFEEYTEEEYHRLLSTNLHGIVLLTQLVGKQMIARGKGGNVIHIGSLSTIMGLPYISIYTITKSALGGLTRALAAEWGQYGIRVNCILPGFVLTALNYQMWQSEELVRWRNQVQALPQMGKPEDIAPLAVFLGSKGAEYITGQCIAVDGGCSTTAIWPFKPK